MPLELATSTIEVVVNEVNEAAMCVSLATDPARLSPRLATLWPSTSPARRGVDASTGFDPAKLASPTPQSADRRDFIPERPRARAFPLLPCKEKVWRLCERVPLEAFLNWTG